MNSDLVVYDADSGTITLSKINDDGVYDLQLWGSTSTRVRLFLVREQLENMRDQIEALLPREKEVTP